MVCGISFRKLKNAIKILFFLYLRGLGTKIRFLSEKKWGRIFVPAVRLRGKILVQCALYIGVPQYNVGSVKRPSMFG